MHTHRSRAAGHARGHSTISALGLVAVGVAGCTVTGSLSPSDQFPAGDAGAVTAIRLEPEEATLRIVGDEPVRQPYRVFATFEGGREAEVPLGELAITFRVLDEQLGTFIGAEFVSYAGFGGRTQVEARLGGLTDYADLTLEYEREVSLPPLSGAPVPADVADVFARAEAAGVDPARAPALLYPNGGTIFPPNLGTVEVHTTAGASNTLFELAFTNTATDVRFYGRCERPAGVGRAGQCLWALEDAHWRHIAETNRGNTEPLTLRVRATDDAGTKLGVSSSIELRFSEEDLRGALYYWTTSDLPPPLDGPSVLRFDFGDPAAEPEPMITQSQAGNCVGCHTLSRDGTKLLASVGGQWAGGVMVRDLEVELGEPGDFLWRAPSDNVLQFASFSPDGSRFVGVFGERDVHEDPPGAGNGGDLILFETECANPPDCVIGRIPLGGREASHPDWSADGRFIGFTDVGISNTSQRPLHGGISYVVREGDSWSAPVERIPRATDRNRYNPTFAPVDASIFAFNESVCPTGDPQSRLCNGDTDPSAKVWAAATEGSAAPILLEAAMARGPLDRDDDLANTFPRFAPFVFVLDEGEFGTRTILWLTFSSTRNYGIREPVEPSTEDETDRGTYLWMVAVEPERVARGEDPSSAAFALPFQDLDTSNHIGVWAEKAVGEPILR